MDDLREILDDPDIDAVMIATPDHWHTPAAIMACQAGKHVYVEKPCSHTVREGRLLIEAAARNKVIVQHGTQVRSTDMMIEAVELLREGIIGGIKLRSAGMYSGELILASNQVLLLRSWTMKTVALRSGCLTSRIV